MKIKIIPVLLAGLILTGCASEFNFDSPETSEISESVDIEDIYNLPEKYPMYAHINIYYNDEDYAKNASFRVYVDGVKRGKIERGDNKYFEVYLTNGKHEIYLDGSTLFRDVISHTETFEVSAEKTYIAFKIEDHSLSKPALVEVETKDTKYEKEMVERKKKEYLENQEAQETEPVKTTAPPPETKAEKITAKATIKKTESQKLPTVSSAYVDTYNFSGREGMESCLYADGDFQYIEVEKICERYDSHETDTYSLSEAKSGIIVFQGSDSSFPDLYITPYDSSGNAGETVACSVPHEASHTVSTGALTYSVDNKKGEINCKGGTVAGCKSSYVCDGGSYAVVRKSLGDKWHVTAKNICFNYGITWYELWDTDDGDYYGWVDENYINFYSSSGGSSSSSGSVYRTGEIDAVGDEVAGFTTDYVCNGGAFGLVRKVLPDGWHVTAKNVHTSYGVTWYELWDTDDGDYYGWVDENYIYFYN